MGSYLSQLTQPPKQHLGHHSFDFTLNEKSLIENAPQANHMFLEQQN